MYLTWDWCVPAAKEKHNRFQLRIFDLGIFRLRSPQQTEKHFFKGFFGASCSHHLGTDFATLGVFYRAGGRRPPSGTATAADLSIVELSKPQPMRFQCFNLHFGTDVFDRKGIIISINIILIVYIVENVYTGTAIGGPSLL